ncbi:MAG: AAA family ATPase, partial [Flavobacteriales bacterium]
MKVLSRSADSKEGVFRLIVMNRCLKNKRLVAALCCRCGKVVKTRNIHHNCDSNCELSQNSSYICVDTDIFAEILNGRFRTLNDSQRTLVVEVITKKPNIFITGGPGVGKSYVMSFLRDYMYRHYLEYETVEVTASSNIAASLIKGETIHKFLQIKNPESIEPYINLRGNDLINFVNGHINRLHKNDPDHMLIPTYERLIVLMIDEVQQINADLWSFIDYFLRIIRNKMKEPFGGVWLIACGDVMQIPPIFKKDLCKIYKSSYYSLFFQDPSFSEGNFHIGYLKEIVRQSDRNYIDLISSVRLASYDEAKLNSINDTSYFGTEVPSQARDVCAQAGLQYDPDDNRRFYLDENRIDVSLWTRSKRNIDFNSTRKESEEASLSTLTKTLFLITEHDQKKPILDAKYQILGANLISIEAHDSFSSLPLHVQGDYVTKLKAMLQRDASSKLESTLSLNVGMLVQLTLNIKDHPKRSLAVVSSFTYEGNDLVKITLRSRCSLGDLNDGISFTVEKSEVTMEHKFDEAQVRKGFPPSLILKRRQFPFADASVMLIHNCIGMTIDVP